ncbi:MAG: hypothetical protein ACYTEY_18285, partial [Planctomycetota bacterium]
QPINFPGLPNDEPRSDAWGWFLFGILLPAIGEPRDNTRINGSRSSLCPRGVAPKAHAADRAGRRLTLVHDAPGVCDGVEGRDTLGKE